MAKGGYKDKHYAIGTGAIGVQSSFTPTDEEYSEFNEKVAATEAAEIAKVEAPAKEAAAKESVRKERLLSGKRAGRRSTQTGAGLGGAFQGKRRTLLGG